MRYQIVPEAHQQVRFLNDGIELTRWHFGLDQPRPCFYPLRGPAGVGLTRMGHPGAPNHDHHQSVWFAHNKVAGVDFWANTSPAVIRQREWLCYQDGDEEAVMAVLLDWLDGHNPAPLLSQTLVAACRAAADGGTLLELQSEFVPQAEQLELGQTNFGFLAVRVARELAAYFGQGELSDSEGRRGEPEIFGQRARWMDYSGPILVGTGPQRRAVIQGITFYDHPANPGFPSGWHVREDGWMGASACRQGPLLLEKSRPLRLRYLLHAHGEQSTPATCHALADDFAARPLLTVRKSMRKHTYWEAVRE